LGNKVASLFASGHDLLEIHFLIGADASTAVRDSNGLGVVPSGMSLEKLGVGLGACAPTAFMAYVAAFLIHDLALALWAQFHLFADALRSAN
jgi:hypothetical protein